MADSNDDTNQGAAGGEMSGGAQQQPQGGQQSQGPKVPDGYLHQSAIDDIIERRLARERQSFQKQLSEHGFESLDEVAKLKKAQAEREKAELEERQEYKQLAERIRAEKDEEIKRRDEELKRVRSQYLSSQAERAVIAAATTHGAVVPEQVARLIRDDIRVDEDGRPYVADAQGNPRTDGKGGDLTVDAYVSRFLTDNPHFQRAADGRGAGGRGGGGNPPPTHGDIDIERAKRDPDYFLEHEKEIERRIKSGELTA